QGETVTGQILTSGQADAWTFEGTAGERVAITLDGIGGWDTFLELVAPNGVREDMDDDGGPDLNSWLSRPLAQTGTYTVLARPFSTEGCTGDYMVLGWLGPPNRSDPNTAAGALGTTRSFTFRGSLREFGEQQPWAFEGQEGAELILDIPRNVGSSSIPSSSCWPPTGRDWLGVTIVAVGRQPPLPAGRPPPPP